MMSCEPTPRSMVATLLGDARTLPLPDASVEAIVTDPPYGLEFMGKDWDAPWKVDIRQPGDSNFSQPDNPYGRSKVRHGRGASYGQSSAVTGPAFQAWSEEWASEAYRVLKPGGHLAAFGGARTWHRMVCAIEDAGLEIRDSIAWLYGSGFPKSLDVSKAIDKAAGVEREVIGVKPGHEQFAGRKTQGHLIAGEGHDGWTRPWASSDDAESYHLATAPATEQACKWSGFGTALKPGHEPIVLARKPLAAGTVAANVLAHGTGVINVDACRILGRDRTEYGLATATRSQGSTYGVPSTTADFDSSKGRWPTNVVLSHSSLLDPDTGEVVGDACADGCVPGCPVAELDAQTADLKAGVTVRRNLRGQEQCANGIYGSRRRDASEDVSYGDSGGASRFFPVFRYQAKAPSRERPKVDGVVHATVKPLALMRWLIRMVTPPGGLVLDQFAGSGTTGEAAALEGLDALLIESHEPYLPLIASRLARLGMTV